MRRGCVVVSLVVLAAFGARAARAEPTPQEKILAQSLFDDARAKMQAGDYVAACPKLAESYRLDAAPGTFLNLGLCHEAEGKLATAYAELSEALSRAIRDGRSDRQKTAREHLAAIAPRLSKLRLSVGPGAPPDLHVEVDGIALARAAWDVAVPMDPGQHIIVASGSGRLPRQIPVTIAADGSTKEIEIGELDVDPNARPAIVANPPPPPVEPPKPPPPVEPPPSRSSPLRIVGFSSLGVGGAALIAGGIFGGLAASMWSSAKSECPGGACPTDAAVDDGRRAGTFADVATVSLVAGAILAAAGLTLVLLAPSSKPKPNRAGSLSASAMATATATATSASVILSGSF